MLWEKITIGITIITGFLILITDKFPSELIFLGELLIIWNTGIISNEEALIGFSNSGLIAIGALYIVVRPLSHNQSLKNIFSWVLNSKYPLSPTFVPQLFCIINAPVCPFPTFKLSS